jgi:excisionase family DNA binding protein
VLIVDLISGYYKVGYSALPDYSQYLCALESARIPHVLSIKIITMFQYLKDIKNLVRILLSLDHKLDKSNDMVSQILERMEMQSIVAKDMLTVDEAARYLGMSSSTLYKLTSSMAIPHYKPTHKTLYFKRSELDDWLRQFKKDINH